MALEGKEFKLAEDWVTLKAALIAAMAAPALEAEPDSGVRLTDQVELAKARRLEYLALASHLVGEIEHHQRALVEELRDLGARWREIADAMNVTHSAVQQRYRKLEEEEDAPRFTIEGARSSAKFRKRPAELANSGYLPWAVAAEMRDFPSAHYLRRALDEEYELYDGESIRALSNKSYIVNVVLALDVLCDGSTTRSSTLQDELTKNEITIQTLREMVEDWAGQAWAELDIDKVRNKAERRYASFRAAVASEVELVPSVEELEHPLVDHLFAVAKVGKGGEIDPQPDHDEFWDPEL